MKKLKLIALIGLSSVALFTAISIRFLVRDAYMQYMSYIDRHYYEKIDQKWKNQTDKYLLRKLKDPNPTLVGIAAGTLCERNSKEAFSIFKELTQSNNDHIRWVALKAISSYNNEESMNILLGIIKAGSKNKDYMGVLHLLSMKKYEPIYTVLVDLATNKSGKEEYSNRQYAVSMIKEYEKKEALPMLEKIINNDPDWTVRTSAENAIKYINEKNSSLITK
jgi:HEAT repeat protein